MPRSSVLPAGTAADLVSELVRLSPVELDVPRLIHLAYMAEALTLLRRRRPLTGCEFERTRAGIDSIALREALATCSASGAVRITLRPSFYEAVATSLRPGHDARPATPWEIRSMAAFVTARGRLMTRSGLRGRVMETLAVRQAEPGNPIDLALTGDLHL